MATDATSVTRLHPHLCFLSSVNKLDHEGPPVLWCPLPPRTSLASPSFPGARMGFAHSSTLTPPVRSTAAGSQQPAWGGGGYEPILQGQQKPDPSLYDCPVTPTTKCHTLGGSRQFALHVACGGWFCGRITCAMPASALPWPFLCLSPHLLLLRRTRAPQLGTRLQKHFLRDFWGR